MKGEGMSKKNDPAGILMQRIGDAVDDSKEMCPGSKATILLMAAVCVIEMEMAVEMDDEDWCSAILGAVARVRFSRKLHEAAPEEAPFMSPIVGEA